MIGGAPFSKTSTVYVVAASNHRLSHNHICTSRAFESKQKWGAFFIFSTEYLSTSCITSLLCSGSTKQERSPSAGKKKKKSLYSSLSRCPCLDLWKHISQSSDFFIPVSLSLSCSLSALSHSPPPPRAALPLSALFLFSFSALMFLIHSQYHTNFLPLSLSPRRTCALGSLCTPPFPYQRKHPSNPCLSVPLLSHPSPLFEVIRALVRAHATPVSFYPRTEGKKKKKKKRRGMYLDPAGAQSALLLCEMIHSWLIALLGSLALSLSKQTTSGCGIFHPNWLEL